jgi:AraC-like DNA-binding protein
MSSYSIQSRNCETGDTSLVPSHPFRVFETRNQMENWRERVSYLYDVTLGDQSPAEFRLLAEAWKLGELVLNRNTNTAQLTYTRGHTHLRKVDPEYLHLRVLRRGASILNIDGRDYLQSAGKIHLVDYSRTMTATTMAVIQQGAFIPHSAIGYDPSIHPPIIEIDLLSPLGHILGDFIDGTFDQIQTMDAKSAAEFEPSFCAFVSAFVRNTLPEEVRPLFQAERSNSMHRFIDQNIHLSEIGIESLLAKFGAARATIYRDFENDGGVGRYVMERRLEKACDELGRCQPQRGLVQEIAEKWHFSSTSYFCRLFKQRFGVSPGEIAGRPEVAASLKGQNRLASVHRQR